MVVDGKKVDTPDVFCTSPDGRIIGNWKSKYAGCLVAVLRGNARTAPLEVMRVARLKQTTMSPFAFSRSRRRTVGLVPRS